MKIFHKPRDCLSLVKLLIADKQRISHGLLRFLPDAQLSALGVTPVW
ncbi:MAG: hypothetical protein ACP5VQ_11240 [Phycisphaerae bacterium]